MFSPGCIQAFHPSDTTEDAVVKHFNDNAIIFNVQVVTSMLLQGNHGFKFFLSLILDCVQTVNLKL